MGVNYGISNVFNPNLTFLAKNMNNWLEFNNQLPTVYERFI